MPNLVINNDILFSQVVTLLGEGREVTIPVKGCSMLPLIREGKDSVTLAPPSAQRPFAPGDIVLFMWRGSYVLHRILSIKDGVAEIQGDGNVCGKEYPTLENIFGRAVSVSRGGRPMDPNAFIPRLLFRIWLLLRPLRRYFLYIYRHLFFHS